MITFVTTFGDEGLEMYGRKFLTSFIKHWDFKIIVYHEDKVPDIISEKIEYRKLRDVPGVGKFLSAASQWPVMMGKIDSSKKVVYNYNIFKFCRRDTCLPGKCLIKLGLCDSPVIDKNLPYFTVTPNLLRDCALQRRIVNIRFFKQ